MNISNKGWIAAVIASFVWNIETSEVCALWQCESEISIREDKTVMTNSGELSLTKLESVLAPFTKLYINQSELSDEVAKLIADKVADGAMQYLYISQADISSAGMKMIIDALNSKNCELADLTIFGDKFHEGCDNLLMEDIEAELLISTLRENTSLQYLLIGAVGVSKFLQNSLKEVCNGKGIKFLYFER